MGVENTPQSQSTASRLPAAHSALLAAYCHTSALLAAYCHTSASNAAFSKGKPRSVHNGMAFHVFTSLRGSLPLERFLTCSEAAMRKAYARACGRLLRSVHGVQVASRLVQSTTGAGFAYEAFLRPPSFDFQRLVGGGAAHIKLFSKSELEMVRGPNNPVPRLLYSQYELLKVIPAAWFRPGEDEDLEDVLGVRLPLEMIVPKLDVHSLRDLCEIHDIFVTSRHHRSEIEQLLMDHVCEQDVCEDSMALLKPYQGPDVKRRHDLQSSEFAAAHIKQFAVDTLKDCLSAEEVGMASIGFKVKKIGFDIDMQMDPEDLLVRNIPLAVLLPRLTVPGLHTFAAHHKVRLMVRMKKQQCIDILSKHACQTCRPLYYVLTPVGKTGRVRKPPCWIDDGATPFLWDSEVSLSRESYPPRPTTMHDIACAMREYCKGLEPGVINEAGCTVCGQLTKSSHLSLFDRNQYDLSVLEELGCSRQERRAGTDTVRGVEGPILDVKLDKICVGCSESLSRGQRPKWALANHLWVGEVPDCLKDLTLAEMAMVTRVRYNRCVVRISSGHAKMTANVIAFEHPTMKVYQRLPMGRRELEDVLAVLYTGAEPPGDDDLRRSPVFVRRLRVKEALEWLKLNHRDYGDLDIDYETLDSYPLKDVPVGIFYKKLGVAEGNVPDASKSVFDNILNEGTERGPCPYTVHGLTAERYASMTTTQRKLAAVQQLKNGGKLLAVGHDPNPQSIWSNPRLYPQMFPWLFPYGHGGVDADEHAHKMSRESHLRWLLNFHDKRFQRDAGFIIVAFNHQQIRESSQGSFMMAKRRNFRTMVDTVHQLDPGVLRIISERLINGGRAVPQTPEEQRAFRIFDQIDYVGNRVSGSMAKRKYLRGEVWSMAYFMNTPAWFFTISPADNKHPLCIHWAGDDEVFRPEIKDYETRKLLITRNPVACARFFHHLVLLFIKHICGWTDDGPKRGLFGMPAGFYGTVEQQGRMTLHLHFLLWIQGQMSLNDIRKKLTEDSEFVKAVSDYVESCTVGGFTTGTKDEVDARVPRDDEYENRGIHSIMRPEKENVPADYVNPTLTLPEAPPEEFCDDVEFCGCDNCENCRRWYERFQRTLDDIFLRSNVHQCFERRDVEAEGEVGDNLKEASTEAKAEEANESRQQSKGGKRKDHVVGKRKSRRHATAKGCINKYGQCTARFPREVHMRTTVEPTTGHLNIKHTESSVNDVAPAVVVSNLCNTDARFLLSGTAVKATIGYVTDYITKGWLKTYQIFSTMYDTFTRHGALLDDEEKEASHTARKMILKVVNSLSSKMEIGAPMAALYLLGNPDHYTSHEFISFYWKNYVNFVEGEWKALETIAEPVEGEVVGDHEQDDVGVTRRGSPPGAGEEVVPREDDGGEHPAAMSDLQEELYGEDLNGIDEDVSVPARSARREEETVRLTREGNYYMAKSNSDDYRYRPEELDPVSLYEFIQCMIKYPVRSTRAPPQNLRFYAMREDHPQAHSHVMACDPDRRWTMIPNFIGPQLPRRDLGDREEYCRTMLTFFRPWRTGIDLKAADKTWEEAFNEYPFTPRAREIMENFSVRHECYDARDDYSAILKAGTEDLEELEDDDSVFGDEGDGDPLFEDGEEDGSCGIGPATQSIQDANARMFNALRKAGWSAWENVAAGAKTALTLPRVALDESIHSAAWRNIVKVAKLRAWRRKLSAMGGASQAEDSGKQQVRNDVFVVPSTYLSKDFQPAEKKWGEIMQDVIREFTLNQEQEKAFRIVANHACEIAPEQMLMHLGGMAGTGKSTVIRALTAFFNARKELYRFVLMGPTGTSAALIGGSTYHSFLGLNTGSSSRASVSTMEEVKERLTGVGYLLIDEQSMLNCRQLCAISARCCDALGVFEKPFGGLNVILCGDFAQLPPAKGYSLYSREVSLRQSPRQSVAEQENTIGKLIWLQFTTAVVLTENMRQIDDQPEEKAFQKALLNLRWYACTKEDIALFRSRIGNGEKGHSVDSEGFKNVSIITARNRDKDHLNAANSNRFASECGQGMHEFYSVDSILSVPAHASRDPGKRGRVYSCAKKLTKSTQAALWQQPPCTSENVAGKLTLCIGMPILIRHNEATELCMTRGQEARVIGWTSVKVPRYPGRCCLDVLYAELINPPHTVNLPHLPKNVVPLTRIPQAVDARLVNDEFVHISRSQVPVLPNFSMTDYSSQGKTRPWNVVDLTECRNFQAAYTCLSRGTRIGQTLILREFSDDKLTGKLDGALRQEYRELDYLTTITDLRYRGILRGVSMEGTRWAVIDAYRAWKAGEGMGEEEAPTFGPEADERPDLQDVVLEVNTLNAQKKRKARDSHVEPKKKRKMGRAVQMSSVWESPVGPIWDSVDHSCAFDAWVFLLHSLWSTDKGRWSRTLGGGVGFMQELVSTMERMPLEDPEEEVTHVRDHIRKVLRASHPRDYVAGTGGVDVVSLSRHLWGEPQDKNASTTCSGCGRREEYENIYIQTISKYCVIKDEMSVQAYVDEQGEPVMGCEECGECTYRDHTLEDIVTFQVFEAPGILLNSRLDIKGHGCYRLGGVIYHDAVAGHFVGRTVGLDNKVYTHDGMNGAYSEYEGVLGQNFTEVGMGLNGGGKASLAMYVRVNVRRRREDGEVGGGGEV